MDQNPTAVFKAELVALIPNLRAFATSLCGSRDQADDLVQETLVKAWDHMASFRQGTNLRAWLFTILRNTFFSQYRKRRREHDDHDGSRASGLATLPEQQSHVDLQDFRTALDSLPPDQREALILVGAAGFSYQEAAEVCGCAIGTVKSRVNRARTRLGHRLSITSSHEYGPEPIVESVVAQGRFGGRLTGSR